MWGFSYGSFPSGPLQNGKDYLAAVCRPIAQLMRVGFEGQVSLPAQEFHTACFHMRFRCMLCLIDDSAQPSYLRRLIDAC